MKTLTQFIKTLNESLSYKTRENGSGFYCIADRAPEFVQELAHVAHADFMPDDYRYEYLATVIEWLANNVQEDDSLTDLDFYEFTDPDCMSHDLLRWIGSNLSRMEYADQVLEEMRSPSLSSALMAAQEMERYEVGSLVVQWIIEQEDRYWIAEGASE